MAVCRFWMQGNCRNGDACKFEHPGAKTNRFAAFGAPSGGGSNQASSAAGAQTAPYNITEASIVKDLTEDRPPWIFSSYGPGKNGPVQLFGGPETEQSFEELRLHFWKASTAGNPQSAINDIDRLYQQTMAPIENAIKNPAEALRFLMQAESNHPNRLDICKSNSPLNSSDEFADSRRRQPQQLAAVSTPAFGAPAPASSMNTFGQVSAFGKPPNPFSSPSATTPGQPFQSQPAIGQTAGSAFGQPSQLGRAPVFGTPSQPSGGPSFGQPSLLAQRPAFGTPALGQPSAGFASFAQQKINQAPAFGQSTPMGAGALNTAFGQPSSLGQKPSPFASAVASNSNNSSSSPFSTLGAAIANANSTTSNPFGRAAVTSADSNPFGQLKKAEAPATNAFQRDSTPATVVASPFGAATGNTTGSGANYGFPNDNISGASLAPNPFQQTAAAPTSFHQPGSASSMFGRPSGGGGAAATPFYTGGAASLAANGMSSAANDSQHPAVESYTTKDLNGRLTTFKGQRVTYQTRDGKDVPTILSPDGKLVVIWFPHGPPAYDKDTEFESSAYTPEIKGLYEAFAKSGRFEGGLMPEVPPKREWCLWDF